MTLDIRGSLKNTKLSTNPHVVFEELISNAIDSYLIRKASDPHAPDMKIEIDVTFVPAGLDESQEDRSFPVKTMVAAWAKSNLKPF